MTSSDESKGGRSRDEVLAGEYVLGALSAEERRKVEERIGRDLEFAAIVHRWAQSVSEFSDEFGGDPQRRGPVAGNGAASSQAGGPISRLWTSLALWRLLAFASLIVAFGSGLMRSGTAPSNGDREGSLLVAELSGEGNSFGLAMTYDDNNGRMQLGPAAPGKPSGKDLQVWLLAGNQPARSLGLLSQTGDGKIEVPKELRRAVANGSTVAVSLEPVGGSLSGKPSEPFIAQGVVQRP
ncbi:anti-sigma factor [Rhizobiaceae bacterium n13]|uniref:Anti-sigma factor n=1 Tax=Ferirhizobium litorale TaxID=2927786 RepID=A0AAE3QCS8_9HYPH|nr:anti-sigma factor [Fererhizobium litorale]MDI7862195.1 anti-sigma factor [Fererhizobium litorale]MDI7922531.1 anti-sigma factor [Fererhizobium litorale]